MAVTGVAQEGVDRCVGIPAHVAVLIPCIDSEVPQIANPQGDLLSCLLSFVYLHKDTLRASCHTLFALNNFSLPRILKVSAPVQAP